MKDETKAPQLLLVQCTDFDIANSTHYKCAQLLLITLFSNKHSTEYQKSFV